MKLNNNFSASIPKIIANAAYLVGLFNILANVLKPFRHPAKAIDQYFLVYVNSTAFATSILTGIALIYLARNLKRRKRRAWNLAILFLTINIGSDFFRFHRHIDQIFISLFLLIALLFFNDEFSAKSDPTTKWRPLIGFFLAVMSVLALGIGILYFRHGTSIIGYPSFSDKFLTVTRGLLGLSGPVEFASDRIADTVGFTLGTFGFFVIAVPIALYLRRIKPIAHMDSSDITQIQEILQRDQFADSLSYFATRYDKSVIWSSNGKAGVVYRVENGVMLASGDPFGEFSLWPEVIDLFLQRASEFAWTPAVIGCTERAGAVWIEKAKMIAIDLGDEAIVNVADFSLDGRPMKNVREMINKITRKGYSTRTLRIADLEDQERNQLINKATEWRYGVPERGFSMALDRFLDPIDNQSIITIAETEGKIMAFLSFVPWGKNSLSLDRMQRDRNCESGVNELLIASSIENVQTLGILEISLNFASFKSVFEAADKISAGPIIRLRRNFFRVISVWFQVESLYRFNAKFQPEWRTRYVLVPAIGQLFAVGLAALRAEKFLGATRKHAVISPTN